MIGIFDLLIKNARVYDPENGWNEKADLAVANGCIAAVGQDLGESLQTVDAEGCWLTHGFIDHHAHVYEGGTDFAMPAGIASFPSGVTTIVDGGSAGISGFESFYHQIISSSVMEVKAYLHVSSIGQTKNQSLENADPAQFDLPAIKKMCRKYAGSIKGLKIKQNRPVVKEFGFKPLERAVEIADEVGLRLSVHASDLPGKTEEILSRLRSGDIFCHMYHQMGSTLLDENDRVLDAARKARARGVLFEVGHGSMQFSGHVAGVMLEQGFLPDIISSDLSLLSMYKAPAYSFGYVMSELLNLGMALEDVLRCCIQKPAEVLGMTEEIGLRPEAAADLALWRIVPHKVQYQDRYGNRYDGKQLVKTEMTLRGGIPVYRAYDFV